jgi:thiol:disulfide interchange protein DsbC
MLRAAALALCLAALPAGANEAQIRKVLEQKLQGVKIEGIAPAPVAGLWEVRYRTAKGIQILYSNATASHVIDGRIVEIRTERDLTEERLRKLNAIRFDSLPMEQAVKIQRGNGKRVLAMFSDPYCPACKQFEQTLQQIDDITIYVFMYPVIRPELADHSKAVWCSPDRSKAWLDLALRGQRPTSGLDCETPIDKNVDLGHSLGVNSTPTLIFANGERVAGGMRIADLVPILDKTAASR